MEILIRQISTAVTSSLLRHTALSTSICPLFSAVLFNRWYTEGHLGSHLGNITLFTIQFQRLYSHY